MDEEPHAPGAALGRRRRQLTGFVAHRRTRGTRIDADANCGTFTATGRRGGLLVELRSGGTPPAVERWGAPSPFDPLCNLRRYGPLQT
ncbi:Hypothetical protein NTJ_09605 [Nesidiocoris tenuis]|uniref:Uncharacterized protein n=1 Tax=Nesidiocoris tenuis TaxID=355587 RepID=A0ABN7AX68_9HEMI|nr:Hypothetical protein NTJ_09605 [Nesidiocoris tenuis]